MSNAANKLLELMGLSSASTFTKKYDLAERINRRLVMECKADSRRKDRLAFIVVDRPNFTAAMPDFNKGYKIFAVPHRLQLFDLIKEIRQMITLDDSVSIYLVAGATVLNPTTRVGELF